MKAAAGGEDCGSTQHILLLDEFYRTAVRLAGKRILWNMVPCDEETLRRLCDDALRAGRADAK